MTPSPMMVLQARAAARALLYRECEIERLEDATEPLWNFAEQSGVTDRIGYEAVREIIRKAFEGIAEV